MDDNYNIFGNFENLSSVNILKKLSVTSNVLQLPKADELGEFDLLKDLDDSPRPNKREKGAQKTAKATKSKVECPVKVSDDQTTNSQTPEATSLKSSEKEPIGRRTRSSTSRANPTLKELGTSYAAEVTRSRRTATKKNTSMSQATTSDALGASEKTRGRRGRKKTTNASTDAYPIMGVADQQIVDQPRNVMRARRNFIAERAARCTTVDFVDLVSSPLPRIQGVVDVTLDSDEEGNEIKKSSTDNAKTSSDSVFDEENPEVSIKILWKGVLEVFTLRKYQKFECVFEELAKRVAVQKNKILLNIDNKIISENDTPASINYKIFQLIYGRSMVDTKFLAVSAFGKKKRDPNLLSLKIQSDKWKRPLNIELQKTETFKKLIIKCAEELKMPYEQIKLSFDGETLQVDQTPIDLELEGGEVLEIHLKDVA